MYREHPLARRTLAVLFLLGLAATGSLAAQGEAAEEKPPKEKPPLAIAAVRIEPAAPAADTLCQLRVEVTNAAERPVSALDFGVALGGTPLKVYEKQLFLENLAPGATTEIRLYNFWTTETGRPAPADGNLRVTVTLRAAQWVGITTEDDGTEVWTLGEAVPGLPVTQELVVPLKK